MMENEAIVDYHIKIDIGRKKSTWAISKAIN